MIKPKKTAKPPTKPDKTKTPKLPAEARTLSMLPTQRTANPIDLDEIQPDPKDARKRHTTKESVADIISTLRIVDGVALPLHPILVRPAPPDAPSKRRWMIIFGKRRDAAARFGGASAISAEIRTDLSEEQVRDMQLAENIDRQDLSPLELADAIAARWRAMGRKAKADEIAFRLGLRSAREVHRALALASLCPEVRDALEKGPDDKGITLRKALAIATLSDHGEQKRALEHLDGQDDRYVARSIEAHFHLCLVDVAAVVGFDVADATLPGGPCESCPKNTACQRALWADDKDDEARCTDRVCFRAKIKTTTERRVAAAAAAGARVATEEETKAIYPNQYCSAPMYDSGVVDLDQPCDLVERSEKVGPGETPPTWREVLGPDAKPSLVAEDKSGRAHELVTMADAAALLTAQGKTELAAAVREELAEQGDEEAPGAPRRRDTWSEEQKARDTAAAEALERIKCAAGEREAASVWRLVCAMLIFYEVDLVDGNGCVDAVERRNLAKPEDAEDYAWAADVLRKWLARPESTEAEARALAVELLAMQGGSPRGHDPGDDHPSAFHLACRFAGVDFAAMVESHRGKVGLEPREKEDDSPAPLTELVCLPMTSNGVPLQPLDRVQARVLVLCKDKKRTRKQIAAACKDYLAADVDAAIDALVAGKRLDIATPSGEFPARFIAAPPQPAVATGAT